MKKVECDWCDGSGDVGMYSCCGIDMSMNDSCLCPTCGEHWAYEKTKCENCGGKGSVMIPVTPEEIAEEIKKADSRFRKFKYQWKLCKKQQ